MTEEAGAQRTAAALAGHQGRRGGGLGRVLGTLALLVLIALCAVAFLAAVGVDPARVAGGWELGERLLGEIRARSALDRTLIAAGALLLAVAGVALLVRSLAPGPSAPRAASRHVLVADDQGFVLVETRSIAIVATTAALRIGGVVNAKVDVQGTGGSPVRLRVELQVHPGADIKRVGTQVRHDAREAVERMVGIDVSEVAVSVRVLEPDELSRVLS